MDPRTLDHVALWVAERGPIADFATTHLGMHVVDETDRFTLIGSDARRGKLTLFDADGPRQRGALEHVALRVNRLGRALEALPGDVEIERQDGSAYLDLYEGLRIGLVEAATAVDYDLDHVRPIRRRRRTSIAGSASRPPSPARRARRASRSVARTSSSTRATRPTRAHRC